MARIVEAVEVESTAVPPLTHVPRTKRGVISYAARDIGERLDAKALVAFTQSGDTVRRLARLHTPLPLLAFTPLPEVRSQLSLTWGTETFLVDPVASTDEMIGQVDHALLSVGPVFQQGDLVVIVAGSPPGTVGLDQPHPRAPHRRRGPHVSDPTVGDSSPVGDPSLRWTAARRARICARFWTCSTSRRPRPTSSSAGIPPQVGSRTFGGQLISQAIVAAGRTVGGERPFHAINAHFIRGGDVKEPIEYRVERHRDGRGSRTARSRRYQNGDEVFVMLAAFQDGTRASNTRCRSRTCPYPDVLPPLGDHFVGFEERCRCSSTRSSRSTCATRTTRRGS